MSIPSVKFVLEYFLLLVGMITGGAAGWCDEKGISLTCRISPGGSDLQPHARVALGVQRRQWKRYARRALTHHMLTDGEYSCWPINKPALPAGWMWLWKMTDLTGWDSRESWDQPVRQWSSPQQHWLEISWVVNGRKITPSCTSSSDGNEGLISSVTVIVHSDQWSDDPLASWLEGLEVWSQFKDTDLISCLSEFIELALKKISSPVKSRFRSLLSQNSIIFS